MFSYTKKAIEQTADEFVFLNFIRIVLSSFLYMAFLIYRVVLGKLLGLYIPLLCLTVLFLAVYLAMTKCGMDLKMTKAKQGALLWYKWLKRIFNLCLIAITVAGLVSSVQNPTLMAILFAVANCVCFLLQIVFDLISYYVKSRYNLIKDGLQEDIQEITRPIQVPVRFVKRIFKKEEKAEQENPRSSEHKKQTSETQKDVIPQKNEETPKSSLLSTATQKTKDAWQFGKTQIQKLFQKKASEKKEDGDTTKLPAPSLSEENEQNTVQYLVAELPADFSEKKKKKRKNK